MESFYACENQVKQWKHFILTFLFRSFLLLKNGYNVKICFHDHDAEIDPEANKFLIESLTGLIVLA
jgi:hypothetical protein